MKKTVGVLSLIALTCGLARPMAGWADTPSTENTSDMTAVTGPNAVATITDPALNYEDLQALAKTAITEEVLRLNNTVEDLASGHLDLDHGDVLKGYKNSDLKIFQQFGKSEGMDPDILYGVCILTTDTISAITDTKFTKKNLQVTANLEAVEAVRAAINGKFFGVVESACLNSKARFAERLETASSGGQPLYLTDRAIANISDVVFFPTAYAKPSFWKKLDTALPYVINGALITGGALSVAALPVAGIWMSLAAISGSTFTIKSLLPGPDEIIEQKKTGIVEIKNGIRLDLSDEEKSDAALQ